MILVSSIFYFFVYPSIATDNTKDSKEYLTYETGQLFSNTKESRYVLIYNVEFRTEDKYTLDFLTNRKGKIINATFEEIRKLPYDVLKQPNGVKRVREALRLRYEEMDSELQIEEIYFKEFILDKMAV